MTTGAKSSTEEGMPQGGHDQRHAVGFVGFQAPGVVVHLIAQLFGGGIHLSAVLLAHGDTVDDFGHGAKRNRRLAGYILHGWRVT